MKRLTNKSYVCPETGCFYAKLIPAEDGELIRYSDYFKLKMLVKQLRQHQNDGPGKTELFSDWHAKLQQLKTLIDEELSE